LQHYIGRFTKIVRYRLGSLSYHPEFKYEYYNDLDLEGSSQNLDIGLSRFSLANLIRLLTRYIYGDMLMLSRADGPVADGPGCFSFLGLELRGCRTAVR
jgi:hypothetical protein